MAVYENFFKFSPYFLFKAPLKKFPLTTILELDLNQGSDYIVILVSLVSGFLGP